MTTKQSLIALLPCPFCGLAAVTVNMAHYGESIGCGGAYCAGRHLRVPKDAWNTRAHPLPERSLIEKLEARKRNYSEEPNVFNPIWNFALEQAITVVRDHFASAGKVIPQHSESIQTPPVSIASGEDVYKPGALPQDRVEAVIAAIDAELATHTVSRDIDRHWHALAGNIAKAAVGADEAWRKANAVLPDNVVERVRLAICKELDVDPITHSYRYLAAAAVNAMDAPCEIPLVDEIEIGHYYLRRIPGDGGRIWIGAEGGEGGEFNLTEVEKVIGGFYDANF